MTGEIAIVGAGYVGVPLAQVFADAGRQVDAMKREIVVVLPDVFFDLAQHHERDVAVVPGERRPGLRGRRNQHCRKAELQNCRK